MDNIKIDHKLKKIDIVFNKNFYSVDAIKETIDDFGEICSSKLSDKKDFMLSLKMKSKDDIEIIGYEFANYVLALMKNKSLV